MGIRLAAPPDSGVFDPRGSRQISGQAPAAYGNKGTGTVYIYISAHCRGNKNRKRQVYTNDRKSKMDYKWD